jgi:hypothetical protein
MAFETRKFLRHKPKREHCDVRTAERLIMLVAYMSRPNESYVVITTATTRRLERRRRASY